MQRTERIFRVFGVTAGLLLAVVTISLLMVRGQYGRLPLAVATPFLVLSLPAMERLFRCRMALPVFLFGLVYAVGPMLGHCYNFYYHLPWWDKMLHLFGGIMFALVGWFLFVRMMAPHPRRWAAALFAVCFSVTVAVAWEFFEYGADTFFGMDMQDDTVVTHITSYLLDGDPGEAGSIRDIAVTTVNGKRLPVAGYIDIGLNDTMWDMLLETLGTLAVVGWLVWDRGRHPPFRWE